MATITTQERTNILKLVAGMFNAAPGAAYLSEFATAYQAMGSSLTNLATALGNTGAFKSLYPSSLTSAEFATKFLTTLGLQANADAVAWVQGRVNAGQSFASVIVQAVTALDATSDAQFASAKALLANKASVAEYYSVPAPVGVGVSSDNLATLQGVVAKVTADAASVQAAKDAIVGGGNGQSFTLTTGQDVFNGTAGADIIRGVAGQAVGAQDQSTFNSSDILDGGAGDDRLVINMTGLRYDGGATVKNIETLQIGSNQLAVAQFDYNVNQGAYEITGVNTVIYDQITTGETLRINNLTPTATNTNPIPVLSWENEAGSRAGTASVTYRQAATAGTADNQNVVLKNVNAMFAGDGILDIGAGIETITINSSGTVANNTLNNNLATQDTGVNATAADVVSQGSLTKVVLTGSVAIGKVAGVVTDTTGGRAAFVGLTDRFVGNDMGLTADATNNPTESNLLSVGARVTEVDASAMTGSANVRFVAKTDNSATNVTFKGGEAADYVEFEMGNVTASGGKGADTFAFINAQANSTFGEGDTIDGGEGVDTIQFGVNGNAQTYNISETELRNKTSIEVLDLRGQTTNLTLSADFVSKSDTAGRVAVHTDRIVQTSATDALNVVNGANNAQENNATSTVNLSKLGSNQGVDFFGGSGSDRLILNDATFNVLQKLDGGVYSDAAALAAGSNRYDTITVTTQGENVVIDAQDLSNVKNFEGLVLTKNSAAATYNLALTRSFLNANTQATDNNNTAIIDTNFQIGTSAAANNSALSAGDTVTIDVRDLLNTNDTGRAGGFTVRTFDVTSLENAGVTINFIGNTGNLTLAQVRAAGVLVANNTDVNFNDVVTASAANGAAVAAGRTLVFTGTSGNTTSGFEVQGNQLATAQNDTINVGALVLTATAVINGSGGVNTLVVRDGSNISAAALSNVTQLTFDATGVAGTNDLTVTAAQHAAFTGTVTAAGTGANGEKIIGSAVGAFGTALAGVENYDLVGGSSLTVNAATLGVNVVSSNAAGSTITIGGNTVTGTYALANATDVLVATTGANIAGINAGTATTAESLTLTGGITMTAAQLVGFTTVTAAGAADSVTLTDSGVLGVANAAVETFTLANGNDTITFGLANLAVAANNQTVNIAAGGNDVITLNNVSIDAGTKVVNINGFDVANDKVIAQVAGVASITGAVVQSSAGAKVTGLVGGQALTINTSIGQVADFTSDAQFLSLLNTALVGGGVVGDIANGTYTVIAYSGANAGLYQVTIAGGNGTAGGDDVVELIGVLNGVGANAVTAANLA